MLARLRYLLILLIILGTLAPKVTAVLAEILPGFQTIVICTGTEMMTLRVGPDGVPIETTEAISDTCAMENVAQYDIAPLPYWVSLTHDNTQRFSVIQNAQSPHPIFIIKEPSHAPPVPV